MTDVKFKLIILLFISSKYKEKSLKIYFFSYRTS